MTPLRARPWLLCALLMLGFPARAAAQTSADPSVAQPFFNPRARPLEYSGPSADFTNLTELCIGWFGPTNLNDALAGDLWWAASLAVREANEQRPANALPFRLVPRWAPDPWKAGVSELARMVYDEQPLALMGSVDSPSTHLAEQIVAKANLPLVSPITTDKSITLAGVSWMFSCAPSDAAIARALVEDILASPASLGGKLVLLGCTDHESRMTVREVLREFSRRGRMPDFRFDISPGVGDVSAQLEGVAEAKPAIVLIVAGADDAARLVKAVREKAPEARIFGSHAMGRARFQQLAGAAGQGVRFPLLFEADPWDPRYSRFADMFEAERGRPPDYAAVLAYDATQLLIAASREAGPNRARIREALGRLSPWLGLAGPIQFDGTGQNTRTNIQMGAIANRTATAVNRHQ